MNKLILCLSLLFVSTPAIAADAGVVMIDPMPDAGAAGSAAASDVTVSTTVTLTPPSAALPNPATNPVAAWDEAKAARKTSWPLLVWACLAMLGKALAYGREKLKTVPIVGKAAAWLSVGKRAMWIAAIGAVGSAGFDAITAGGSVVAALIASGIALAGVTHSTTKGAVDPAKA